MTTVAISSTRIVRALLLHRGDYFQGIVIQSGSNSADDLVNSLIRSGAAIPFTAHATSPTITMPRIKAITTGSIPSFLDVLLNFAESDTSSTLAYQDTWLGQLKAKPDGNLVMYGDDTWLKLFPGMFLRADGTSSFFVSVSVVISALCISTDSDRTSPRWIPT